MPSILVNTSRARLRIAVLGALGVLAPLVLPLQAHADTPFVGEVVCAGFNFCPTGYAECNGQFLSISQNTALFSLIGTYYGGNGTTHFAVPDLRGRAMVGQGSGPGLTPKTVGESGGSETVTLIPAEMPGHSHSARAHDNSANGATVEKSASPTGNIAGTAPDSAKVYGASTSLVPLHPTAMLLVGGNLPHNNLQPYGTMKCCIAVSGVFPARN